MSVEAKPVSRYTTAARINHWITAVSLILLALSGMALFHPSLYFRCRRERGWNSAWCDLR